MNGPKRYIVTCKNCNAKTGTSPPGLDLPGTEPTDEVDCVICGFPVSRKGGQYIRSKTQIPEQEFDLLSLE